MWSNSPESDLSSKSRVCAIMGNRTENVEEVDTDNVKLQNAAANTSLVSSHQADCEQLLKKCVQGDYTQMPYFAVAAWHYLSEVVHSNHADQTTIARELGMRAAHLLKIVHDEQEKISCKDESVVAATTQVDYVLLFLAGMFATHQVLWSCACAFATGHFVAMTTFTPIIRKTKWVTLATVGAHAYLYRSETLSGCILHVIAWWAVWQSRNL